LVLLDLNLTPGQVIVMTGGNGGIGINVVEKFLKNEANIILGESKLYKILFFPNLYVALFNKTFLFP